MTAVSNSKKPGKSPRKRSAATRKEILDVAEKILAQRGYAGTRLDDIADQVGVTRQTILFYFKDKSYLYQEVLDNLFHTRKDALALKTRGEFDSLGEYIDYQIDQTLDYYLKHPEFPLMLLRFIQNDGPRAHEMRPSAAMSVGVWEEVLKESQAAGYGKDVEVQNLIALIGGTLSYFMLFPASSQVGDRLPIYDPHEPNASRQMASGMKRAIRGLLGLPAE